MFVKRYGAGSRVIFGLHGWGSDHRVFLPLARRVPRGFALHGADLPGYGQSPAPASWSVETVVEEIVENIRRTEAEELTLVGHCSGAIFAYLATERLGAHVDRLVLLDPYAYVPWYFKIFLFGEIGKRAYFTSFANPIGRRVTNALLNLGVKTESDMTRSFAEVDHEATYRYLQMLGELEPKIVFKPLPSRIALVYGEHTFADVKRSIDFFARVWPEAERIELKRAAHLPLTEATEQLKGILYDETKPASVLAGERR
ncbi:MAG: hypothetical protein C4334_05490 [Pyrinomonas sp.]|uniref:alpha/beta fold hydrolase n=1 Tax=Pyrinomonas sp. TaxID=2080306 RepID=UPI003321DB6C